MTEAEIECVEREVMALLDAFHARYRTSFSVTLMIGDDPTADEHVLEVGIEHEDDDEDDDEDGELAETPTSLEDITRFFDSLVDEARQRRDPLVGVIRSGLSLSAGLGNFWTRDDARVPILRAVVELGRLASELLAEEGAG